MSSKKEEASVEKSHKNTTGRTFVVKESVRKVIKAFLKESIIWTQPSRTRRLKDRIPDKSKSGPPSPSDVNTEDLTPGEIIEVFEGGQWKKKPWKPSLKNEEVRLVEK